MSQVIIANDNLKDRRQQTREQERKIRHEDMFRRWRRNDITGPDPVEKLVGYAVAPIFALWTGLTAIMAIVLLAVRGVFKGIGSIWPSSSRPS